MSTQNENQVLFSNEINPSTFAYYNYYVGRPDSGGKESTKPAWNVIDANGSGSNSTIHVYNIFDHWLFNNDLANMYTQMKKALKKYKTKLTSELYPNGLLNLSPAEKVEAIKNIDAQADNWVKTEYFLLYQEQLRSNLRYYFGSKYEWEMTVTEFPPHITREQLDELNEHAEKEPFTYCTEVPLRKSEKIDVYTQIMLNWHVFVQYVWDNKSKFKNITI